MPYTDFVQKLGFTPKENAVGIFYKKYGGNYSIEIDFEGKKLITENSFPLKVKLHKTLHNLKTG